MANDACGALSGRAWSENAGWIDFAPATCAGDPSCGASGSAPTTGIFSGRAWSENAGWITFSATSPVAFRVATSWRSTAPHAGRVAERARGQVRRRLAALVDGPRRSVDLRRRPGLVSTLRSSHGSYQSAAQSCAANDAPGTSVTIAGTPSVGRRLLVPRPGSQLRGAGDVHDEGAASQAGPRDAGIASSGNGCP